MTAGPLAISGNTAAATVEPPQSESSEFSPHWAKVLIVDDEPINIDLAKIYLQEAGYQNFTTTSDSRQALDLVREHKPDVILLDLMMPHMSGFDILAEVRKDPRMRHIPVIILTASNSTESRFRALELGVNEFLSKPVDSSELLLRLRNTLAAKALRDHLASYSARLENEVRQRTAELEAARMEAMQCLARAAEYRDDDTGQHVVRVGRYVAIIARALNYSPKQVESLEQAAHLHDVGKIGVPDAVLLKPGRLTAEEYAVMKEHCLFGRSIIRPPVDDTNGKGGDSSSPIMKLAASIAETHHEKWDGTGYPYGLSREEIPIEGRITAVADVFDALSTKRPYKDAMSWDKCIEIIREGTGSHFDPTVVKAFLDRLDEVRVVFMEYADEDNTPALQKVVAKTK